MRMVERDAETNYMQTILDISLKTVDCWSTIFTSETPQLMHEDTDSNLKTKGTQLTFTAFDEMLFWWKNKNECLAKL